MNAAKDITNTATGVLISKFKKNSLKRKKICEVFKFQKLCSVNYFLKNYCIIVQRMNKNAYLYK